MPRLPIKISQAQLKGLLERILSRSGKGISESALKGQQLTTELGQFGRMPLGSVEPPLPKELTEMKYFNEVQGMTHPPQVASPSPLMPTTRTPAFGPSPVQEAFQGVEPREVVLSRLFKPGADPGSMVHTDLPYEEARRMVLSGKMPYQSASMMSRPPVNRIRTVEAGGPEDMTGDLAKGLAFERVRYKPPISFTEKKASDVAGQATRDLGRGEAAAQKTGEMVSTSSEFMDLWKQIGGKRAAPGKIWQDLLNSSRIKNQFANPRDYFIYCGVRFKGNPGEFAKKFPREASHIQWALENYGGK